MALAEVTKLITVLAGVEDHSELEFGSNEEKAGVLVELEPSGHTILNDEKVLVG
jgi:hypothetical protein